MSENKQYETRACHNMQRSEGPGVVQPREGLLYVSRHGDEYVFVRRSGVITHKHGEGFPDVDPDITLQDMMGLK